MPFTAQTNSLRYKLVATMNKIGKLALMLWLACAVTSQFGFSQTRPRRVEEPTATPSPAPPVLIRANNDAAQPPRSNDQPVNNRADNIDVLRIETTLVTLPVSVTDRLGRYIPDLQKQDFHVYEEDGEQHIAYFAAVEKPFTVVLMIDTSASNWSKLGQIRAASKAFVEQLRPDDQVMIVSFAGGLTIECDATKDRQKIRKGIEKTGKGLSTHLYEAMDKVMQKHLDRIHGRKAIVLFTDGVDTSSKHVTYESTLRIAEELDALIYPIRYDTYDPGSDHGHQRSTIFGIPLPGNSGGAGTTRADYAVGERYLRELARLTGGREYEASRDLSYLQDAFSHIAEELRRQYSLGYYPRQIGKAGERRHIKVTVDRHDLAVRTRDSYICKTSTEVTTTPPTATQTDARSSPPVLQKKP